jgi:DNA-binding MarR family transcriptional regulator
MLQVTATISPAADRVKGHEEDLIDQAIAEFEPVIAFQRGRMRRIWQDRTVSKLNLQLLMLLSNHGAMPMSRLAAFADVSLPNLSGIIDRMEERGLVERVRDEHDRRVVLVRTTAKGRSSCEELEALPRDTMRQILTAVPEADRRTCLRAFRAMRRAVETLSAEAGTVHVPDPHHTEEPNT